MAYKLVNNWANMGNYGAQRATSKIKYIVVHSTSNDGDTAESNGNYFHNKVVKASSHYFVDDDSVVHSVPDNYSAYSVGGSKWSDCASTGGGRLYGTVKNGNSISVELCDTKRDGTVYPTQSTIDNALILVKSLMAQYGVEADHVIRHFDINGKHCPSYWMNDAAWKSEFHSKLTTAATSPTATVKLTKGGRVILKNEKVRVWQKAMNIGFDVAGTSEALAIDGSFGNASEAFATTHKLTKGIKHRVTAVKWLQTALGITADGSFGNGTFNAVKSFQKSHGLSVDGVVGVNTYYALLQ